MWLPIRRESRLADDSKLYRQANGGIAGTAQLHPGQDRRQGAEPRRLGFVEERSERSAPRQIAVKQHLLHCEGNRGRCRD